MKNYKPSNATADLSGGAARSSMIRRNRLGYLLALMLVIGLGLASRRFHWLSVIGKYPGDALWALMVFLGMGIIFPRSGGDLKSSRCRAINSDGRRPLLQLWFQRGSTAQVAAFSLGVCIGIEFLKFYHAPWMEWLRNAPGGRLVFGYAFSWTNLVAYCVGIGIGVAAEKWGRRRQKLIAVGGL